MQERLALARRLEDAEGVASSMVGIGLNAQRLGDHERAAAAYAEGAELARAGGYTWFLAVATDNLADLAQEQGDYAQAGTRSQRKASDSSASSATRERSRRASSVSANSRLARAGATRPQALLRESLEYAEALVDKEMAIWCLEELAALALSRGRRGAGGQAHGRDRDAA